KSILEKLSDLRISSWVFKEQPDVLHIGPMAQDFHAAFALGKDEKSIATVDADGVAFAAIQGLHEIVLDQQQELKKKEKKIASLETRLAALEELVNSLARERGP